MGRILFLVICIIHSVHAFASDSRDIVYNIHISELRIRDPFVYVDKHTKRYYLYANGGDRILVYESKDLEMWKGCEPAFIPPSNFWGEHDFWAPDVYHYNGLYYMFTTFSAPNRKRGTSIMVSQLPQGPFEPLVNEPITPKDWMSLDGSLYVDANEQPWIIFCREWVEVKDGEIWVQRLSKDLKTTIGEPLLLFRSSQAPWVKAYMTGDTNCYVTDAPFVFQTKSGDLIMTWSSFNKEGKYAIGQATSKQCKIINAMFLLFC